LIRDAERDDAVAVGEHLAGDLAEGRQAGLDDFVGVVLDLPGLGEVLRELPVGRREEFSLAVEGHGAYSGGAGVEGENEVHGPRRYRELKGELGEGPDTKSSQRKV
jgi:hypothetical protein